MPIDSTQLGSPPASLVITNYNGRRFLEKYLPSVVAAADRYRGETEIIVADDCSTDDSVAFLQKHYPEVRIVLKEKNCGFLKNANHGVNCARHKIVILLNNDVKTEEDFISPLITHFQDPNVFSVNPKGILPRLGYANESFTRAIFRNGVLHRLQMGIERDDDEFYTEPQPCLYACGGYAAYDKEKFLLLGGFDELFAPNFAEDFDLGYMAWKAGWENLYEPRSVVYHESHATVGDDPAREVRNHILITWKNTDDVRLWLKHVIFFAAIHFIAVISQNPFAALHARQFRSALSRFPTAMRSRRKRKKIPTKKTDRDILTALSAPPRGKARYQNAVYHGQKLGTRQVGNLLREQGPSKSAITETLKPQWSEWLATYAGDYEARLELFRALRNEKQQRERYLKSLLGERLLRTYKFWKHNLRRVLDLMKA